MRAFVRNDRVMFGPLNENDIIRLSNYPIFEGHGVSAMSGRNGVEIFATLPVKTGLISEINDWYLRHHLLLSA